MVSQIAIICTLILQGFSSSVGPPFLGNYMRKCASGGQSLANAERGVGLSVPVQKIKFSINNLPVYVS